jgi:hypothetical protein
MDGHADGRADASAFAADGVRAIPVGCPMRQLVGPDFLEGALIWPF